MIAGRFLAGAAAAACLVGLGCRPGPNEPRLRELDSELEAGAFVAASDFAELAADGRGGGRIGKPYWLPLPLIPGDGWGRASPLGWRPRGELSTLRLWRRSPRSAELVFDFGGPPPADGAPEGSLAVGVGLNGATLGRVVVPAGGGRGRLPVPDTLLEDVNDVELRFDPPIFQEPDRPPIVLQRFGLLAPGAEPPGTAPRGAAPAGRFDRELGILRIAGSGHFVAPLDLPRGAASVRFDLRWSRGTGTLRLLAIDAEGGRHELLAARGSGGNAWRPWVAPVAELAGQRIFLVFEARLDGRLEIRSPRLTGEPPDEPAAASAAVPARASDGRLPDIVVIVLDAARGDRFLAEYPRRTTPNIDRMAREALVFRRAYSECPSTNCSIPNLLSGVPFLPAGVGPRSLLDDRVRTLPEYLKELGYRTVSFSANPNNSPQRNLDQGFDEFHRLWGRRMDRSGYIMSRRAAEVIAAQDGGEPLFLLLHYLPPHEPYAPRPDFDVFGDPGYRGPVGPITDFRRLRDDGRGSLTDADVERVIDLYDGNLLMADDAVEQVFAAMKAAGRWRESLVVVTSDHGEAFWEHGRQGHNATLFDEMLHVPLILRLPHGRVPADVDTSRLVVLSDVVPTLLARVGLEPAPEVAGVDLLAASGGLRSERAIFHRTSNRQRPTFSVRTPRFKTIVRPGLLQRSLFDLRADPAETRNLLAERPLVYAGLSLMLRSHLASVAARRQAAEEAQLPEEDLRVLRSLGYVD